LENLRDLDISFNMIKDLPEELGNLKNLEHLIIVGNMVQRIPDECSHLANLRRLDCRRNYISDLTVISMLPRLEKLSADHNAIHALPLSLGPNLANIDASYNDITQVTLIPRPIGRAPSHLCSLDISHAKLSALDDIAIAELSALRTLRLDHNSFKSLPDSIGSLSWLETLSCSYNNLQTLPSSIGRLQKLEVLDIHNNSLVELPITLWNCASLMKINATSNLLSSALQYPPSFNPAVHAPAPVSNTDSYSYMERKGSATSHSPPLVYSLEKLYLGENQYTDETVAPLMIFRELKVLNLSFNEIQELPPSFFKIFSKLEELYLSGNKLSSIPMEDLPTLQHLSVLYLNGNKLRTLPQELGKVKSLTVLDIGSNALNYNINNWEFDWNWLVDSFAISDVC
jgi:adenylate cyclase